jgi:hypothetical protein
MVPRQQFEVFFDLFIKDVSSYISLVEYISKLNGVRQIIQERRNAVKVLRFAIALSVLLLVVSSFASAQAHFDGYFGMGSAQVGGTRIQDIPTPHMSGVFGTIGGGVMLQPSYGFGAQVSFRFTQGDYIGYGYRPIFYDFNGIWTPQKTKSVVPEFQAGFGGLNLRYYDASNPYYDYNTGRLSTFAGSVNHFQLHAAAGLRFKVKSHLYIRPQLDYHWVPNLTEQFGSNSVLGYSLALVFSSGD